MKFVEWVNNAKIDYFITVHIPSSMRYVLIVLVVSLYSSLLAEGKQTLYEKYYNQTSNESLELYDKSYRYFCEDQAYPIQDRLLKLGRSVLKLEGINDDWTKWIYSKSINLIQLSGEISLKMSEICEQVRRKNIFI